MKLNLKTQEGAQAFIKEIAGAVRAEMMKENEAKGAELNGKSVAELAAEAAAASNKANPTRSRNARWGHGRDEDLRGRSHRERNNHACAAFSGLGSSARTNRCHRQSRGDGV